MNFTDLTPKQPSCLDEISAKIETELGNTILNISESLGDNLKLGYDENNYNARINSLSRTLSDINSLVGKYCTLFNGKEPSIDVFREVCSLPFKSSDDLTYALKKEYLIWNKIAIPNVPLKIDKLIEVFDFPTKVEAAITEIAKFTDGQFSVNIDEFYDHSSKSLVISQQSKVRIHEEYAKYLSIEGLVKLFRLHLLCEALNGLSQPPYTFRNLPEIDFKLMDLIKVKDTLLAVDLKKVEKDIGIPDSPIQISVVKPKSILQRFMS